MGVLTRLFREQIKYGVDMAKIIITEYARFEAQRRGIELDLVLSIIEHPQQKIPAK
jgi:hypothetical protein